jgi:hypothetical protein
VVPVNEDIGQDRLVRCGIDEQSLIVKHRRLGLTVGLGEDSEAG